MIDTSQGASALAGASGYAKLTGVSPKGALAHVYANPSAAGGSRTRPASGLLGVLTGGHQANVSLLASAGSLTLDLDTLTPTGSTSSGGLLSSDPEAAERSWRTARRIVAGDRPRPPRREPRGRRRCAARAQLAGRLAWRHRRRSTGRREHAQPEVAAGRDELARLKCSAPNNAAARRTTRAGWARPGIFASGGSLLELKAAIVIDSKNPARSRAAVDKLAAALRRSGGELRKVQHPRDRRGGWRARSAACRSCSTSPTGATAPGTRSSCSASPKPRSRTRYTRVARWRRARQRAQRQRARSAKASSRA